MKTMHCAKMAAAAAFFMIAACAAAYDDVQVTYRGRLLRNGIVPSAQRLDMTFRLYGSKGDAEESWSVTKTGVRVNEFGMFQVSLGGDGLAEAIASGKANWIGVTIADGKEQYPRQELLAAPRVAKAATVSRLAVSPSVKTADVSRVEVKSLTVGGSLSIGGAVKLPKDTTPVSMGVVATKPDSVLEFKGNVRFFSGAKPRLLDAQVASGGGCSFGAADCNCAAVFTSLGSDIMPGMTILFKKGETVEVPTGTGLPDGTRVRCLVYAIGAE